jgi:hypothetical protein
VIVVELPSAPPASAFTRGFAAFLHPSPRVPVAELPAASSSRDRYAAGAPAGAGIAD